MVVVPRGVTFGKERSPPFFFRQEEEARIGQGKGHEMNLEEEERKESPEGPQNEIDGAKL